MDDGDTLVLRHISLIDKLLKLLLDLTTSSPDIYFFSKQVIQLGQPSVNPPGLVLEVGGTSTKQAAMPGELKSPPLGTLKWGGLQLYRHSCLQG